MGTLVIPNPRRRYGILTLVMFLALLLAAQMLFVWVSDSFVKDQLHYFEVSSPAAAGERSSQQQQQVLVDDDSGSSPVVIAYACVVTSCPVDENTRRGLMDAAAVLKHSVHLNSVRTPSSGSVYDYQFYVFVHSSASDCAPLLQAMDFQVLLREAPVELHEIQNQRYAKIIDGSGCCGHKEFLKFYSYTLTNHPVAVVMDLDAMVLKPLDHLYDILLRLPQRQQHQSSIAIPTAQWNKTVSHPVNAFFVRDYFQNRMLRSPDKVQIQGGFLVHRTNQTVFDEFRDLVRKGDFEPGRGWTPEGWGGGKVGNGGSDRYQGLVSYYYSGLYPQTSVELNHCLYDQITEPNTVYGKCRTGRPGPCPDCRKTDIQRIYSAHFGLCLKPWQCVDNTTLINGPRGWESDLWQDAHELCMRLHWTWHGVRRDLEAHSPDRLLSSSAPAVVMTGLMPKDDPNSTFRFYGGCHRDSAAKFGYSYVPMQLESSFF